MNVPRSTVVLERRFADAREQRMALPNQTVLDGDNFIHLRAVSETDGHIFDLERAVARAGGLPVPFRIDDLSVLRSREDAAGTLTWTQWTDGAGTFCVLAFRRLTAANRVLPNDVRAFDMVLRNCALESEDNALAPAEPESVAFGAPVGIAQGANVLTISPLAAPMP